MSNGNGYDHTNVEELLELALTRMAAGEGYADIIAAIPPENVDEFEGILQMVQDLEMLADVDVPRDPVAQAASRRSFVAEAEAMCAQHAATSASEDGDAPGFMARVGLGGEMADELLLQGQRVVPKALRDAGFAFRHEKLEAALRETLGR